MKSRIALITIVFDMLHSNFETRTHEIAHCAYYVYFRHAAFEFRDQDIWNRARKKGPPTRCDKNVSKRTSSGTFSQYFLALPSDSVFGVRRLCQKVLWREGRRISNTPWAEGRRISNTPWAEGRRKLLLASFIRFLQMTQYGRNNALKRVAITR